MAFKHLPRLSYFRETEKLVGMCRSNSLQRFNMLVASKFVDFARKVLPSPFSIAVLITLFTMILAFFLTESNAASTDPHWLQILHHWEAGFFSLLKFTIQMMLILVLGHVLALARPVDAFINAILKSCKDTASSAFLVTLFTVLMALFNWGLGLIFGAIFARKIGESMKARNIPINYPLIGAAAYSGLMVWHGGLSGSAPADVASADHALVAQIGSIPSNETIFSAMNIYVSVCLILFLPAFMYWVGKKSTASEFHLPAEKITNDSVEQIRGADRLDHSRIFSLILGLLFLFLAGAKMYSVGFMNFFNLSNIIWSLFALCFFIAQ